MEAFRRDRVKATAWNLAIRASCWSSHVYDKLYSRPSDLISVVLPWIGIGPEASGSHSLSRSVISPGDSREEMALALWGAKVIPNMAAKAEVVSLKRIVASGHERIA